jgi:serine/threonine-protein kinase
MGEVWRATDTVLARTVAVKVLLPSMLAEPGFDARFAAEARMMAALRHRGVVNVYDYGKSPIPNRGTVAYVVMEYVEGQPLSLRIAESGHLPVADTMEAISQAADALEVAHANGIVHRDVKPANLLIQPDGSVVLVDFGIARSQGEAALTAPNSVLGTAAYMAPEQAAGRPVSPATDIYALGAVAYQCLAGHPPFQGGSAVEVAGKHLHDTPPPLPTYVPPAARAVVERALAKDPANRYPSAAAMAEAARAARSAEHNTAEMPLLAYDPSTVAMDDEVTAPAANRRSRGPLYAGIAALAVLLASVLVAFGLRSDRNVPVKQPNPTASALSAGLSSTGAPRRTTAPSRTAASAPPATTSAQPPPTPTAPESNPAPTSTGGEGEPTPAASG